MRKAKSLLALLVLGTFGISLAAKEKPQAAPAGAAQESTAPQMTPAEPATPAQPAQAAQPAQPAPKKKMAKAKKKARKKAMKRAKAKKEAAQYKCSKCGMMSDKAGPCAMDGGSFEKV